MEYFSIKVSLYFLFFPVDGFIPLVPFKIAAENPAFPPAAMNCSPSLTNSFKKTVLPKGTTFGSQSVGLSSSPICSV